MDVYKLVLDLIKVENSIDDGQDDAARDLLDFVIDELINTNEYRKQEADEANQSS